MMAVCHVEAQMAVGLAVGPKERAAREQNSIEVGVLHQRGHVDGVGYQPPQKHTGLRGLLEAYAHLRQLPRRLRARMRKLLAQAVDVLAIAPTGEEFQQDA